MPPRNAPAPRRTPGFEPAKGFPDPAFVREDAPKPGGAITHYPHRNGPACGATPIPTSAAAYSPTAPTCPWCRDYLAAVKKVTAEQHGAPAGDTQPPPTPKDEATK